MNVPVVARRLRRVLTILAGMCIGAAITPSQAATVTPTTIAQIPLTVAVPAHPQIVLAVGNSESMDGSLSGAILTGAGSLDSSYNLLQNSSSPLNYTIPTGFTPPINAGSGGSAPYTATVGSNLVDNSPSRLNVAKAGIAAMLNTFMPNADFALLDYSTSNVSLYTTWLYQMSPTGSGFVFTSTQATGNRYVANPCYNYTTLSSSNSVYSDCSKINSSGQVTGNVSSSKYLQISASSDDPLINDVLYSSGMDPVCIVYGGPSPANPWSYSLSAYNSNPGNIKETYQSQVNSCARTTTPTNAGYVPYTPQTMYVLRGFGYGGQQSATTANTLVSMTSAGQAPTATQINTAIAKFTSYLNPETNSTSTTEIKASAGQSALAGLLEGANTYYSSLSSTSSSNGCPAHRYVILLTDGLPTLDTSGNSWPPPGTTSATQYGANVYFNSDGSLNTTTTNHQAMLDTISQLTTLNSGTSPVKTYVIGLGAGVDPTQNPLAASSLKAMAIAGGTGNYLAATSPTDLTNDLQVILSGILAANQASGSVSVNSSQLFLGSQVYYGKFTTSDTDGDWTGDMQAFSINPSNASIATSPVWSAQTQLDAQNWDTGRLIATWDPVAKQGTPFRWNPALAPNGISSTTSLGTALQGFAADTSGQDVLNYLRGSSTQEQRNSGGTFRNRTHKLADIVGSSATYVGAPAGFSQSTSYATFVKANKSRSAVVYVGANDGMLHAFYAPPANTTTTTPAGNELFAYIPNGVYNNLIKLVDPNYNSNHKFFVNASPKSADVQFTDGSWHTLLVGGEGAGGQSLFALDVTAPDSLTTEAKLAAAAKWEFTDTDMGLSFSGASFANTNVNVANATVNSGGWLVFVGNGYNSANQKPFLYALNPATGAIVKKIDLCAAVTTVCNLTLANGLSTVFASNSYGQSSLPADTVWAGDLQGNVWRVDISDSNTANWSVKVIFQARDASNNMQPITTILAAALNPYFPGLVGDMVEFGTGQLLGVPDLTTTSVQSIYGLFDAPTGKAPPVGFTGIPTRNNLVRQTVTTATADGIPVLVEQAVQTVTLPTNRGWYIDINFATSGSTTASGARVISDPKIQPGGLLLMSVVQPSGNVCSNGGNSWRFYLNYATGGSFPQPELDLNNDGALNATDQTSTGLNPIAIYDPGVIDSSSIVVTTNGPGPVNNASITNTNNGPTKQGLRGNGRQRVGWWEVRQ